MRCCISMARKTPRGAATKSTPSWPHIDTPWRHRQDLSRLLEALTNIQPRLLSEVPEAKLEASRAEIATYLDGASEVPTPPGDPHPQILRTSQIRGVLMID